LPHLSQLVTQSLQVMLQACNCKEAQGTVNKVGRQVWIFQEQYWMASLQITAKIVHIANTNAVHVDSQAV